ncbi:uncharacterized protein Bfra_006117 [Botrytis fragariae]|uniref:Uncharacterized protein n=1 Tax=Botrytis fragariae TaxID=1964551 RepID=A0A8H6ASD1_9HELO|nr:uncharacterized protein Bfra_006117 [Botrytis fragariae]KAF5872754.1 hypothetical protein Bfra_006117 [Botrytis fragariae]
MNTSFIHPSYCQRETHEATDAQLVGSVASSPFANGMQRVFLGGREAECREEEEEALLPCTVLRLTHFDDNLILPKAIAITIYSVV